MSVNIYQPHVFLLPEDKANSDIANGFTLHPSFRLKSTQIMPVLGGWLKVLEAFSTVYRRRVENNPLTHVIMLIDFDTRPDRLDQFTSEIPEAIRDRVFVIGTNPEPEALVHATGHKKEEIGRMLADECFRGDKTLWSHEQLVHNSSELARMNTILKLICFSTAGSRF
jgi:hypothetical protein